MGSGNFKMHSLLLIQDDGSSGLWPLIHWQAWRHGSEDGTRNDSILILLTHPSNNYGLWANSFMNCPLLKTATIQSPHKWWPIAKCFCGMRFSWYENGVLIYGTNIFKCWATGCSALITREASTIEKVTSSDVILYAELSYIFTISWNCCYIRCVVDGDWGFVIYTGLVKYGVNNITFWGNFVE